MDKCTENYECLVLDNTGPTNQINECVYWWKAKIDLPPFKIGPTDLWRLDRKYKIPAGERLARIQKQLQSNKNTKKTK